MTEHDQQRLIIGEYCGMKWYTLKPFTDGRRTVRFLYWPGLIMDHDPLFAADMSEPIANLDWDRFKYLPKYTTDLNAMADARLMLPEELAKKFMHNLAMEVTLGVTRMAHKTYWMVINATAQQQANAFIRTIQGIKTSLGC